MNEAFKRARLKKMLNQSDIAKILQVYPATVSNWERGTSKPRKYLRAQVCTLLEQSAEELGL